MKGLQESFPLCCLCKTLSEEELEEEIKAQERKNVREGERRRKSGSMRRLHCNAERTTAAA